MSNSGTGPNNNNNRRGNRKRNIIVKNDDPSSDEEPPSKRIINNHITFYEDENEYFNALNNLLDYDEDEGKELITITREIKCLTDLIEIGKMYDFTKRYNIDCKTLNKLVEPLTELKNMIGMDTVKDDIVDHILFRIQKLETTNNDMMHTVIQGPPGVGKTELAKIIGKIYLSMGVLKNEKFVKATRGDLIGKFLGHTAKATQKVIDESMGGVLFIDEVYSLGNSEKRDSFSKECIDTLNENLTDKKNEFVCIIAGYKDEINSCFFSYNPGLERRFPVRFTIDEYKPEELYLIFKKKVVEAEWTLDDNVKVDFFIDNHKEFKYFGGDMELLFTRCKRSHSRRIFGQDDKLKKIINMTDVKNGFKSFKLHRNDKKKDENDAWKSMYV